MKLLQGKRNLKWEKKVRNAGAMQESVTTMPVNGAFGTVRRRYSVGHRCDHWRGEHVEPGGHVDKGTVLEAIAPSP